MIDIHTHILAGLDDGARDLDESLAIMEAEMQGGTHTFFATPHYIEKVDYDRANKVAERADELQRLTSAKIIPAGEIYPQASMLDALDRGLPLTLGPGKYMLLDLPLTSVPSDLDYLIYELTVRGIKPILAHPERAAFLQANPARLQELAAKGVAYQVNAASLWGRYGKPAEEMAVAILRKRQAHFLASDSHRPPNEPVLRRAVDLLQGVLPEDYLHLLTRTSGEAVLSGERLPELPEPPLEEPKKGFFGRLWKGA